MGRSNSCFKLIACGSDAADNEEYEVSEVKDSNDKRGWSFRKRSARHRVLSNTVITETTSSANKESTECASTAFQSATHSNVVEKKNTTNCSDEKAQLYDEKSLLSDEKAQSYDEKSLLSDEKVRLPDEKAQLSDEKPRLSDEKPQLSLMPDSQISEAVVVAETESKVIVNPLESSVIIIQTAIRQFLAQRALLKLKNVVKLQAAVRGHLVRSHAVGTLRCVQAIVKMQILVRARRAQQSHSDKVLCMEHDKNDASQTLETDNQMVKSNATYTSIEKLLSNRFACQLLESTPKNKPIRVKCDLNKANSAWKWLERWMSVSSIDTAESKNASSTMEQSDNSRDSTSATQVETFVQYEVHCQHAESKHTSGDSVMPMEDNDQSMAYDSTDFNFQASHSPSLLDTDNLEQALPEKITTYDAKVTSSEVDSHQGQKMPSDAIAPKEFDALPQKPEIDSEQPKRSMKRFATDQLETEGKKLVYGSKKASNPAYIAAQSKFEGLSSKANSSRTSSLSYQDAAVESQADTPSFGADTAQRTKEFFSLDNSVSYTSRFAGSECGTELSITSTLDSPDISEAGVIDNEHEAKDLVEGEGVPDNDITTNDEAVDNVPGDAPASNSNPSPVLDQREMTVDVNGKMVQTVSDVDTKEQAIKSEKNASELQREQAETVLQDFRNSPEASPKSYITLPESQGTPSSQVSLKAKESKSDNSGSGNRRRHLSAGNKSPANANRDSGSRGSKEQPLKEQPNGKRRNSFGSVKPDHVDQETRDHNNNINSSLPHFMQATESARAKISANNSPRSSPDVHDPDMHIKKRHSLPGATGKRGSPRVPQSTTQPQHSTKGNSVHPPHVLSERKWLR